MIKDLPEMQEMQVRSQGQEDPLEEEMATHSNVLDWEIPWTQEAGGLQSMGKSSVKSMTAKMRSSAEGPEDKAAEIS